MTRCDVDIVWWLSAVAAPSNYLVDPSASHRHHIGITSASHRHHIGITSASHRHHKAQSILNANLGVPCNGSQIMKLLSWLVYIPLQILILPLSIVGVILVAYRQMLVSKRLAVSQTAIEVFNGRWTRHVFGMRSDPSAAKLGPLLPNTSTLELWLTLFPLWLKAKIAGGPAIYPRRVKPGHETVMDLITGRTVYFDHLTSKQLPHVEQFVLMGGHGHTALWSPQC